MEGGEHCSVAPLPENGYLGGACASVGSGGKGKSERETGTGKKRKRGSRGQPWGWDFSL